MNKRQRKKKETPHDKNIFILEILINENEKFNPKIKIKGWIKFFDAMKHYSAEYHCDMKFKMMSIDKQLENDMRSGTMR